MNEQDKMWDYFQNEVPESFSGAKPRMDFLIKQIAQKNSSERPIVLNVGVGEGYFEETTHKKGWDIFALDPSQKVIKRMNQIGVKGYAAYMSEMPFEDGQFDFVVATEVLEHLSEEERTASLTEVHRVLKNGGFFIGTVPFGEDLASNQVFCPSCEHRFHRWGHQQSFRLESLAKELSPFMKVMELRRTAFVSFKHRSCAQVFKQLIKLILAKCGEQIATPSIYFCTRKE